MARNDKVSRKQRKLIQALSLGQSVASAAKANGIAERTAYRWLDLPHIQAERKRLEDELCQAEEAEITRIMTTGYAATHERVKALDYQAREMEKPYVSQETGNEYHLRNSPEHMKEWRGLLDDIAKETGGRASARGGKLSLKSDGPVEFVTEWGGGALEDEDSEA
jgi:hypothetical protein